MIGKMQGVKMISKTGVPRISYRVYHSSIEQENTESIWDSYTCM